MRTALIYPFSKAGGHQCVPPSALLYLGTALKQRDMEVRIFDVDGYPGGWPELMNDLVEYRPSLGGLPSYTDIAMLRQLRDISREMKERLPNTLTLVGGPHATACPGETLDWFPDIDLILRGEADYTLCELVEQLSNNVAQPEVAGLCYRSDGRNVLIPPGPSPNDLDNIPIPDRKLLWDNYQAGVYWLARARGAADLVVTSRGCPYNCKFCFKMERGYRPRSPENVLAELVYLASIGVTNIDIEDDLFTGHKKRCIQICNMIQDAGLRLNLKVRSHVKSIDEELLQMLRKVGVRAIVYGIESGSQKMLDAMNKRATVEENYRAIRLAKAAGLQCYADVVVGFPGETLETLAETRRFLLKARPTAFAVGVLLPFPGTQVYEEAKANGTLVGDWSVEGPVPFVKLECAENRAEVWRLVAKLYRAFYMHPLIILAFLRHNALKMDLRSWKGIFRYVRTMMNI